MENEEPTGWNGFATHVERLATHYTYSDKDKFERDFVLIWGGIPIGVTAATAMMSVGHGPHELIPLGEQNTGLRENLLDDDNPSSNQSHHYAGLHFLGYQFGALGRIGATAAHTIGIERERDTLNAGDVLLGDAAIEDAYYFRSQNGSYEDLVARIRALAVDMN